MQKRNGSALITSLITVMIIVVLASSLLSLSFSSYKNTKHIEENRSLKLIAQSGIEKSYVAMKNYIVDKPEILLNPKSFNPSAIGKNGVLTFDEEDGNITNIVKLESSHDKVITDLETGKKYYYIKVESIAKNNETEEETKIIQYIDRVELYNPYFSRMFNSAFTAISPLNENKSCIRKDTGTSIKKFDKTLNLYKQNNTQLSGNIYIQDSEIKFKPEYKKNVNNGLDSKIKFSDVDLYLKGKQLDIDDSYEVSDLINGIAYEDNGKTEENRLGFTQINLKELYNLKFEEVLKKGYRDYDGPKVLGSSDIQVFDTDYEYVPYVPFKITDKKDDNAKKKEYLDIKNPYVPKDFVKVEKDGKNLLIKYRAETDGNQTIDFNKLINGGDAKEPYKKFAGIIDDNPKNNDGIYEHAVEELKAMGYKKNYMEAYGQIYKIILIDGDLIIPSNKIESFINYVVYCTGTVTFEGESSFYNSSVFAKDIIFKGDEKTSFQFNGVNSSESTKHIVNNLKYNVQEFTPEFKGMIHKFLIQSLEGYAEALEFNVIKTEE